MAAIKEKEDEDSCDYSQDSYNEKEERKEYSKMKIDDDRDEDDYLLKKK